MIVIGGIVIGVVVQGSGCDDFVMSGGMIGVLQQGDNIDIFCMSGGCIVGVFEDGDQVWMIVGCIGCVNMKLDKNLWDQFGGIVDGNVVIGFDIDIIIIFGMVYIGGNISVSGGNDSVIIIDGIVCGQVLFSIGDDIFNWSGGGIVYGVIDMGLDNDVVNFGNFNQGNLGVVLLFDGGSGIDQFNFSNVKMVGVGCFQNWEMVWLVNSIELSFDGDLVLGDSSIGIGMLMVDDISIVYVGSGGYVICLFNSGVLVEMVNVGCIDLIGIGVGDVFIVCGNYCGDGGGLYLCIVLGVDNFISDCLVIDGGFVIGIIGIGVFNVGGSGVVMLVDGILVVQVLNGGCIVLGVFLLFVLVVVGVYEYFLFKGGVSVGISENWYL